MNISIRIVLGGLIVAQLCGTAMAESDLLSDRAGDKVLRLQFSPYTLHYVETDEFKPIVMVGLEREHPNAKVDGFALFTNSFGQPSVYVYPWGGIYHGIWGNEHLSFKWTAGLLYGYVGPYKDRVPLNYNGFSPAIIPALVYEFKPGWSAQVNFFGVGGVMFQFNAPLN